MPHLRQIRKLFQTRDLWFLLLSIVLQLGLGLTLGNLYDQRINMAAGYAVGTGHNPYIAQDLSAVFHNSLFHGISTIGYPPPWTIMLGFIYKCVYALSPNFLSYNVAIKIPIIAANICLAYLITHVLMSLGAGAPVAKKARNFMLLNPAVLVYSAGWGQIDSIVAFISLAAVVLLKEKKTVGSVILLALAISLKPITLPLMPAVFVYLMSINHWKTFGYFMVFFSGCLVFCVLPFVVFGWDPAVIFRNWNAHFTVAGCMSFLSITQIWNPHFRLDGPWQLLGILWAPALLCMTAYFLSLKQPLRIGNKIGMVPQGGAPGKKQSMRFEDLLKICTAMMLIFFLTRAWISEPNILAVLPFVLILTSIGLLSRSNLTLLWTLPLGFSLLNDSLAALLFPSLPHVMNAVMAFDNEYRVVRLVARTILVIPWLYVGWRVVIRCSQIGQAEINPLWK